MSTRFGERRSSHASATCMGVAPRPCATETTSLIAAQAAQQEEWDIRNFILGQPVDQRIVGAVSDVVVILHADDRQIRRPSTTCQASHCLPIAWACPRRGTIWRYTTAKIVPLAFTAALAA